MGCMKSLRDLKGMGEQISVVLKKMSCIHSMNGGICTRSHFDIMVNDVRLDQPLVR